MPERSIRHTLSILEDDLAFGELQRKYELTAEDVKEATEKAISLSLSRIFNCEVDVMWNGRGIEITRYIDKGYDLIPVKMKASSLRKNIVRLIKYEIAFQLSKKKVLNKFEQYKNLVRTAVGGYVSHVLRDRIVVEIERTGGLTGECHLSHQPPRERGLYEPGDYYSFFVLRMEPVLVGKRVPHLEIKLSRTTKSLPEYLLRKELREMGLDIKLKCKRRIAGALSYIEASKKVPKEAILNVSKELKERIIVKYA